MIRNKKLKKQPSIKPYFIIDAEKLFKPNANSVQDVSKETEDLLNGNIYSNALKKSN